MLFFFLKHKTQGDLQKVYNHVLSVHGQELMGSLRLQRLLCEDTQEPGALDDSKKRNLGSTARQG